MSVNVSNIGVLSFAKLQAFIFSILGLLAGIIYSFGGLILDILVTLGWISSGETPGLSIGTVLAFGALLGMPLIGATFGFFFGIIEALVFNVFSNWIGGIEIYFEG